MPQSVRAAVTKYHKLSGLSNKSLFLTVLEAREFKITVPEDPVSKENSLFLVHRWCLLAMPSHGPELRDALSCLFLWKHQSHREGSTLMIQLSPIGPIPNSITLRIGDSITEFWEDANMKSIMAKGKDRSAVVWRDLHSELNVMIPPQAKISPIALPNHQKVKNYNSTKCLGLGGKGKNICWTTMMSPHYGNFFIEIKYHVGPHNMRIATRAALNKTRGLGSKFSPPRPFLSGPDMHQRTQDSWGQSEPLHKNMPSTVYLI